MEHLSQLVSLNVSPVWCSWRKAFTLESNGMTTKRKGSDICLFKLCRFNLFLTNLHDSTIHIETHRELIYKHLTTFHHDECLIRVYLSCCTLHHYVELTHFCINTNKQKRSENDANTQLKLNSPLFAFTVTTLHCTDCKYIYLPFFFFKRNLSSMNIICGGWGLEVYDPYSNLIRSNHLF